MAGAPGWAVDGGDLGMAPSRSQLVDLLTQKRLAMLAELRDVEQALEALERTPEMGELFTKVSKLLGRLKF